MNDEVKQIGEFFRTKRKERNLSLKEVENSTSIRLSYLEAIEDGRSEQLLSSVYIHGFIKQYANFLECDIEKMISSYPSVFAESGKKHDFAYGIGTLEVRGSMGGGVRWFPNLIWAGVAAVVLVLAWYLTKYLGLI